VAGGIVWWRHDVSQLRKHGVETKAHSVGAWKETKGSSVTYRSTLNFIDDKTGDTHSMTVSEAITEGTFVPIVYDPANPDNAVLKSGLSDFMGPRTWPGVLCVFGVLWMIGVITAVLKGER
jgi:hypothetical protein